MLSESPNKRCELKLQPWLYVGSQAGVTVCGVRLKKLGRFYF